MTGILEGLNPAQLDAVTHKDGPLVVFAGAGSGKTRIITRRIGYLIEQGVAPWEILAVTFTNKAAAEMKARVASLTFEGRRCQISTFHSMCARWLREFAEELGFTSDFTIYDDSDSNSALKKLIKEKMRQVDLADVLGEMKSFLHQVKTMGLFPNEVAQRAEKEGLLVPDGGIELYAAYQEYLAMCNAMDFGDLIMNMLLLMRRNEKVRQIIQRRYRYAMVDEFQDTNACQLELVTSICAEHKNLFVVGDDDQAIYSWRGATPRNLLEFDKLFPGAATIKMEQNYRSAKNIVAAASAMIQTNRNRANKRLFSELDEGPKISYKLESDGEMESWYVVDTLKSELSEYHYSDFAIFYRTNSQSRLIEDALRRDNIPYKVFGSVKFYDRLEVKDIMAYLRLLINEDDDVSLRRVINVPARGIGNKAVEQIAAYASENEISMMSAARQLVQDNVPRLSTKLSVFLTIFEMIKKDMQRWDMCDLVPNIIDVIDYKAYLQKKFPEQFADKLENLHELSSALADYGEREPEGDLRSWINTVTLVRDESDEGEEVGVSLMTLHTAKGLEYKRVFIVGVEDGLIPHRNNIEDPAKLEEERRLFYVGMTRAMERLSLVGAEERMMFNQHVINEPSQFLKDIPSEYLRVDGVIEQPENSGDIVYDFDDVDGTQPMREGASVLHPSYGRGVIIGFENNFGKRKALVRFREFGHRKVPLHHLENT